MADMDRVSRRIVEFAERFADVNDAAQGRGKRLGRKIRPRWLVLPAAGAGLYALGTNGSFLGRAKRVASQAKDHATDLPDTLLTRARETTGTPKSEAARSNGSGSSGRQRSRSGARRTTGSRAKR
jgi:hypothetical protein